MVCAGGAGSVLPVHCASGGPVWCCSRRGPAAGAVDPCGQGHRHRGCKMVVRVGALAGCDMVVRVGALWVVWGRLLTHRTPSVRLGLLLFCAAAHGAPCSCWTRVVFEL